MTMLQDLEIRPNVYYTPDEAATMLRVSRRSVMTLLRNGFARGVRIGGQWRILGSDLLRLPEQDTESNTQLVAGLRRLSEPVFTAIWDNDEDSVYDGL